MFCPLRTPETCTELGALVAALTLEAQQAEEFGEECISNPAHKENLLHRLWKAKHPRSGLAGTLDEQGNILEGAEGHQALIDHWAKVFEAAATCPNAMREVLLAGVPKLEISCWLLDYDSFCKLILKRKSSAPGPDGVSFGCLKAARGIVFPVLYRIYCLWLDGGTLPDSWNVAWLWLLLKGDDKIVSAPDCREPKDTRPLSGSDCTAKVLPACITAITEGCGATHKAVTRIQEGFIKERHMLKNVGTLENRAYLAKLQFEEACIVFLDFLAAFPSLCRVWLFAVLGAMGIPEKIVQAIRLLCEGNHHIYIARVGRLFMLS